MVFDHRRLDFVEDAGFGPSFFTAHHEEEDYGIGGGGGKDDGEGYDGGIGSGPAVGGTDERWVVLRGEVGRGDTSKRWVAPCGEVGRGDTSEEGMEGRQFRLKILLQDY